MGTQTQSAPRPRAILSTQDFKLLRVAVAEYVRNCGDEAEAVKYANLFHRLGRAG
jgi:hypothetical protein